MSNYYCLMAGLPDLELTDRHAGLTVSQLKEESDAVLTGRDRRLAFYFYLRYDCRNLLARLQKGEEAILDPLGNYTREELDEIIDCGLNPSTCTAYPAFLPAFVATYSERHGDATFYARDEMLVAYLQYCLSTCPNKMLRRWYELELHINNILCALIARRQGWATKDYVKGEGEIQELIATSRAKDFDLTRLYDFAGEVIRIAAEDDPVRKEQRTDALRWQWLDEETFFEPFSFEALFAYLSKLEMLERWARLDVEQGREAFRQIIDNLRSEAKVPEEFIR